MKTALTILCLVCLWPLASCGVTDAYVAADRLTFEAVAPEYLHYVEADGALTDDQKQSRRDTVETWRMRIEAAVPEPEEEP